MTLSDATPQRAQWAVSVRIAHTSDLYLLDGGEYPTWHDAWEYAVAYYKNGLDVRLEKLLLPSDVTENRFLGKNRLHLTRLSCVRYHAARGVTPHPLSRPMPSILQEYFSQRFTSHRV